MSLPYNNNLISRARELRKDATKQEQHLWYDFLRSYRPRFQRQKTIGSFIADFYCHAASLIIELDGSQHYSEQGEEYDKQRTAILESNNLRVIRFANTDIDRNFAGVCKEIDRAVKEQLQKCLPN